MHFRKGSDSSASSVLSFLQCGVRYVSFHLMGLRRPNLSLNNRTFSRRNSSIEAFHVQQIYCRIKYIIPANVLKKKNGAKVTIDVEET